MSDGADFKAEPAELQRWLFDTALPLWSTIGVDHEAGGFFERLTPDGVAIDDPRRARLVARQIYVFATAERLGWTGAARALVRHGLDALFTHHLGPSGLVVPAVDRAGRVMRAEFDLYDHAFVLFGLAAAAGIGERPAELAARARLLLADMRAGFAHPMGGFVEAQPGTRPLKANPHMHLLEASLAWEKLAPGDGWGELADEIADLCLTRFINPGTGAVHEYFDRDWHRLADHDGSVVEPGHQFEWAWLLMKWGGQRGQGDPVWVTRRLISLAEASGVDPGRGMAVNELNADLSLRDGRARLWPQTERIKAHKALAVSAKTPEERVRAEAMTAEATRALRRFFDHPVPGCWWEHIDRHGAAISEPARASSLYHIMCAMEVAADDEA